MALCLIGQLCTPLVLPQNQTAYRLGAANPAQSEIWYSQAMDWRRLERWATWATIALYVAAAVSVIILLGESLLPAGSPAQQIFHGIANHVNRLGEIGGGTLIYVILLILIGGGIYVLILRAIDKYHENRERRARERAEAIAEGHAEGRAEGHAEGRAEGRAEGLEQGRAEVRDQLQERGYNLDDLLGSNGHNPDLDDSV